MIEIAGRRIGNGHPCYLVAEIGVNHDGDPDKARELIDAAARSGADAVKFQIFTPELLASHRAPKARYQTSTTDAGETQLEMLQRLALDLGAHRRLMDHCRSVGITYLVSVFDEPSVRAAASLQVAAVKIPSGELTNHDLLRVVSELSVPTIISTGMATLEEVEEALRYFPSDLIILLHCLSAYPAPPDEVNLRAITQMRGRFTSPIGFSDHTLGLAVAIGAVAMGACLIEKHLTLDRRAAGPDHSASLEPSRFKEMAESIRVLEDALGDGFKRPMPSEADTAAAARKSVVAARDIKAGTILREDDLTISRPGTGLNPQALGDAVGRTITVDLPAGEPLSADMFS